MCAVGQKTVTVTTREHLTSAECGAMVKEADRKVGEKSKQKTDMGNNYRISHTILQTIPC